MAFDTAKFVSNAADVSVADDIGDDAVVQSVAQLDAATEPSLVELERVIASAANPGFGIALAVAEASALHPAKDNPVFAAVDLKAVTIAAARAANSAAASAKILATASAVATAVLNASVLAKAAALVAAEISTCDRCVAMSRTLSMANVLDDAVRRVSRKNHDLEHAVSRLGHYDDTFLIMAANVLDLCPLAFPLVPVDIGDAVSHFLWGVPLATVVIGDAVANEAESIPVYLEKVVADAANDALVRIYIETVCASVGGVPPSTTAAFAIALAAADRMSAVVLINDIASAVATKALKSISTATGYVIAMVSAAVRSAFNEALFDIVIETGAPATLSVGCRTSAQANSAAFAVVVTNADICSANTAAFAVASDIAKFVASTVAAALKAARHDAAAMMCDCEGNETEPTMPDLENVFASAANPGFGAALASGPATDSEEESEWAKDNYYPFAAVEKSRHQSRNDDATQHLKAAAEAAATTANSAAASAKVLATASAVAAAVFEALVLAEAEAAANDEASKHIAIRKTLAWPSNLPWSSAMHR